MKKLRPILPALVIILTGISSCTTLNDDRIPSMPVNIVLDNQGIWATYGVHGFGEYNNFILTTTGIHLPAGFPYSYNSATGFGGVLLIGGQNAYTGETGPLAYDLSCPVERQPDIRVYIDETSYEAVCPVCESHYQVTDAGGAPTAGPALVQKYALTQYQCYATINGGYIIRN